VTLRESRMFATFGFATTHDALTAEAALKAAGIPVTPVPAPRELGSLCGIALRLEISDADRSAGVFAAAGTEPTARADIADV
jgi:hypothetical protein